MKKYTDTELLEKLLPILGYSIDYCSDKDNDIIDIKILESHSYAVNKSFVVALQDRINELAKKIGVEATNIIVDEDENIGCNKEEQEVNGTCMPVEDNRDYKEEYRKMVKENHRLKVLIELLLEEIDHLRR